MNIAPRATQNRLTKKQEIAARALADPAVKTMSAAAKKAGVSRRQLYRMYQNAEFQETVQRAKHEYACAIEGLGSDTAKSIRVIADGFDAMKTSRYGSYPDHRVRLAFVDLYLRIKGILPDKWAAKRKPQKSNSTCSGQSSYAEFQAPPINRAREWLESQKGKRRYDLTR